ncbi:hypothetical protein [Tardiphaga sp. 862_B3_N1_1]|uniref:hypothetical protein n=1 Tax=Tardiphaga sp. 862_B3_N1_1 TaxID=3240763 RepID=UPI003F8AF6C6
MTTNHTQGLMKLSAREKTQNGYKHGLDIDGQLVRVADVYGSTNAMWDSVPGAAEGEVNARRLVACWNACQGLDTEMLENLLLLGETLLTRFKARDAVEQQLEADRLQAIDQVKALKSLQPPGKSDEALRKAWRAAGGDFHGPNIETGTMPEADLLTFLRRLAHGTPGAQWRQDGEPDPHGTRYDCERAELAMGSLTDDELANGAFMNYDRPLNIEGIIAGTHQSPIAWMTATKDRIRWLSRALDKALAALPPAYEGPYTIEHHGDAFALYQGRDTQHHGYNLARISEVDPNRPELLQLITNGLNAQAAARN